MNVLVGANNLLSSGAVVASHETTGYEKENAYDEFLTDQWVPGNALATLIVDNGSAANASYLGLVHSGVTSVAIEGSADGISYDPISTLVVSETVSIDQFTLSSYRYHKLTFAGSAEQSIAQVNIGESVAVDGFLVMPFTPFKYAAESVMTGSLTAGGLPSGRSVIFSEYSWNMNIKSIEQSWLDSNWSILYSDIVSHKFFILWDSVSAPSDVLYAWLTKDATPKYNGTTRLDLRLIGGGYR